MVKTCFQTVEVYYTNSEKKFFAYEISPPRPEKAEKCPCVVKDYRGVVTTWYPDRTEVYYYSTKIKEIYWNRPSLQDVLSWNFPGQYYRKHPDGVVEWGYGGFYYRWEPDEEVVDESDGYAGCECDYDHPHDPHVDTSDDDTYCYCSGRYDND